MNNMCIESEVQSIKTIFVPKGEKLRVNETASRESDLHDDYRHDAI